MTTPTTARASPIPPMAVSSGAYASGTENRLGSDGYQTRPTGDRPIETMTSTEPIVASHSALLQRRDSECPSGNQENAKAKQATSEGRWTEDAAHAALNSRGSIGRNAWWLCWTRNVTAI